MTVGNQPAIVGIPTDLSGLKNEVLVQKAHRFGYEHAVRNCGVKLVEVETPEDVDRAITDKTAMMLFYNNNNKLEETKTTRENFNTTKSEKKPKEKFIFPIALIDEVEEKIRDSS